MAMDNPSIENNSLNTNRKRRWLYRARYDELLFVCQIRRALRIGVALNIIISLVKEEFINHLYPDIVEEEALLFSELEVQDPLRIAAEKQHAELRKLATIGLNGQQETPTFPEIFADMLEENIRFEERILFPFIENKIKDKVLKNP